MYSYAFTHFANFFECTALVDRWGNKYIYESSLMSVCVVLVVVINILWYSSNSSHFSELTFDSTNHRYVVLVVVFTHICMHK